MNSIELNNKPDLRIKERPRTTHPDLNVTVWCVYNNTPDVDYDFGIVACGYIDDHNKRYYGPKEDWPRGPHYFLVKDWPEWFDSDLNLYKSPGLRGGMLCKSDLIKAYEDKKNELGL